VRQQVGLPEQAYMAAMDAEGMPGGVKQALIEKTLVHLRLVEPLLDALPAFAQVCSRIDRAYATARQAGGTGFADVDWPSLQACDELIAQMQERKTLVGFVEGDLAYPPTADYAPSPGARGPEISPSPLNERASQRYRNDDGGGAHVVPRWSERILWRCHASFRQWCTQRWVPPPGHNYHNQNVLQCRLTDLYLYVLRYPN
jgi:hypothetical protein